MKKVYCMQSIKIRFGEAHCVYQDAMIPQLIVSLKNINLVEFFG